MRSSTLILLGGYVIKYISGNLINLENSLEPELVNQNQVLLNRKEKFIKFDTKDNNLEIELGISVPFIKVPLTANKHLSEAKGSKITINAPGLIVAGILTLTSFLIIPLLFTKTNTGPSDHGFGFQRKKKADMWSFIEGLNNALSRSGFDSSSCVQKCVCWIAKTSEGGKAGSIGQWINYFAKSWWLSRLTAGTLVEDAVQVASNGTSCGTAYSHCSLTNKHLHVLAKMIAAEYY